MENKFDKIAKFVESLERTSLSEDQQVVLLAGGPYDDTTTLLNLGNCNTGTCTDSTNKMCNNTVSCNSSKNGSCTNSKSCIGVKPYDPIVQ